MNPKPVLLIASIFLLSLGATSISAQRKEATGTPTPSLPSDPRQQSTRRNAAQPEVETADVAITASVTAKELLFEIVPNPKVEFPGKPSLDTIWEADRDNLPTPVQPGVTYRNIGIRLRIVSRFKDIDRIVAEALGEVPLTDEVQPPKPSTPQPPIPPQGSTSPQGGSPR